MKLFHVTATATAAAALALLLAACSSSAWPPAGEPVAQHVSSAADTGAGTPAMRTAQNPPRAAPASKPPVLSVGVSDPDTQLILPWFLTDMIDAVNSHESFGDFLNAMKAGL
ncbi:hypothetical protein [Paraburkholderia phenoliruptrix]|uniref:Lipoprotein n=2 Tax=Paraburkholderia phenoliruptrix TaxID=252970 RepID=K0E0T8_9BURK|nr:hypothetical protein [Paraburkholderia phenoliruptrix]AFT89239.1 hypothetical protein BUPH_05847 [Paraburkholderia phenoliruptrix BR3459a]MDR6422105.1 hypothetical protein [Paraburkholderia phenoliruptrix]CAB4050819.1 hypothetical protein LMG9964_04486 [Paraburkholderia phenoliruptrix]